MMYILMKQLLWGKYSKWIVILQESYLEFEKYKSKKSLVVPKLLCDFPHIDIETIARDSFSNESLFLISTLDLYHGDIVIYLQTKSFRPELSKTNHQGIWYQSQWYNIIGDTLYHHGANSLFRHCLTFQEAGKNLNDYHFGACGGHMSGYATAQNILRAGYFWLSMFKDCITTIKKFHNCQIYDHKLWAPPAPLHRIIVISSFAKCSINFVTCNRHSARGHRYIILAVDHFKKWAKAMPTYRKNDKTTTIFIFIHVIARSDIPKAIVIDRYSFS